MTGRLRKYHIPWLIWLWLCLAGAEVSAHEFAGFQLSADKASAYQGLLQRNQAVVRFIEEALVQNGLPKMMRNLALIESGFDQHAVSQANACGIWQFTAEHASDYGLNSEDRFDIYRSTQAAVQTLKDLYARYHNWIAVVAAYNCGAGQLDRAIRQAASGSYLVYSSFLPEETTGHVQKFLEACYVTDEWEAAMADYKFATTDTPEKKGSKKQAVAGQALIATKINAPMLLSVIAEELDIAPEQLHKWNPDLDTELAQEGSAELFLPVDRMPDFLLLRNRILERSIKQL